MQFQRIKKLPKLRNKAIETAVEQFVRDSRVKNVDEIGMFNQTIESIAQATIFASNEAYQFWMADNGHDVMAYALAHVGKDVDNQLTYTISQAWVCKQLRGKKIVRVWFKMLEEEAKRCLCKHVMFPASRHVKPYLRYLKGQYHEYVTILKRDI